VKDGFAAAVRGVGLDATRLELTAALRLALESSDALRRWLAGEPIFADAYDGDLPPTIDEPRAASQI
jgi:hypothetical protein